MIEYLKETDIIDFSSTNIESLAKELAKDCNDDEDITRKVFTYVRDEIKHVGDFRLNIQACKASEVLEQKAGWCYAKSHLLAALLRANKIPTGFCYQRLSCNEYKKDIYCLHGLNAVYLKNYGWYRIDARGNKQGVNAKFNPPVENLAFKVQEHEFDLAKIYADPLSEVVEYLQKEFDSYENMSQSFPDIV